MTTYSDDAQTLAGDICAGLIYPMLAEFICNAHLYCACHAVPLTDDQVEQLSRAMCEAVDGTYAKVAEAIDARQARALLEGLSDA